MKQPQRATTRSPLARVMSLAAMTLLLAAPVVLVMRSCAEGIGSTSSTASWSEQQERERRDSPIPMAPRNPAHAESAAGRATRKPLPPQLPEPRWLVYGTIQVRGGVAALPSDVRIRVSSAGGDREPPEECLMVARTPISSYEIPIDSFRELHPYERGRTSVVVVAGARRYLPVRSEPMSLASLDPLASERLRYDLVFEPGSTLDFVVLTELGSTAGGAVLRVLEADTPAGAMHVERADSAGRCLLPVDGTKQLTIQAHHPMYGCGHVVLPGSGGNVRGEPIPIVLRSRHSLRVRLLFPNGSPISQHRVHARLERKPSSVSVQSVPYDGVSSAVGRTDSEGRLVLNGLENGGYRLIPYAVPVDGGLPAILGTPLVETDSGEVEIRLDLCQVSVETESDDPRPIGMVRLRCQTWLSPPQRILGQFGLGASQGGAGSAEQPSGTVLDLDLTDGRFLVPRGCWMLGEIADPVVNFGGRALLHVRAEQDRHTLRIPMAVAELSALLRFDVRDPMILPRKCGRPVRSREAPEG
jgi:hypothetical protein